MIRRFLVLVGCLALGSLSVANADAVDPLHGYCAGAGQCVDNGTNSPTNVNPPVNFGFTVSPSPASGDLLVDVLATAAAPDWVATANSGAIFDTVPFAGQTPLPGAFGLFGSVLVGGLGLSTWKKRRRNRGVVSLLA